MDRLDGYNYSRIRLYFMVTKLGASRKTRLERDAFTAGTFQKHIGLGLWGVKQENRTA